MDWTDATYTNGKYLVTGNFGTVLESTDGINWSAGFTGEVNEARTARWGNNRYVVSGFGKMLAESANGTTWTPATPLSALQADFFGMAFGAGKFVAVGIGGIYYSADGINWTLANTGAFNSSYNIVYGNGLFVAEGGASGFLTSTDGVTWTVTSGGACSNAGYIAWDTAGFMALSPSGICLSPDGLAWTLAANANPNFSSSINQALTSGNGHYFIVNDTSAWASPDRVNWTQVYTKADVTYPFTGMAASPSGYVLVGFGNQILHSADLVTWTSIANGTKGAILAVDYLNGQFVRSGESNGNSGLIAHSSDGITWTSQSVPAASLPVAITHSASSFYAVTSNAVLSSTDGVTWASVPLTLGAMPVCMAYGNGRLLLGGPQGLIATSTDGQAWNIDSSGLPTTAIVKGIAYGASRYVAVTSQGQTLASTDGTNWTLGPSGGGTFAAVTYGNSGFVAVGANGVIWQSADGLTWKPVNSGTAVRLVSADFSGGRYVVAGDSGTVLTSTDAVNWIASAPVTGETLNSIAFGAGRFVAVGTDGVIISSGN